MRPRNKVEGQQLRAAYEALIAQDRKVTPETMRRWLINHYGKAAGSDTLKEYLIQSGWREEGGSYIPPSVISHTEPKFDTTDLRQVLSAKPLSIEALCDVLEMPPKHVRALIQRAKEANEPIQESQEGYWWGKTAVVPGNKHVVLDETGEWRKLALVSDTHGGSIHEQLNALQEFYALCQEENVPYVFHAGDIIHGRNVYQGQEHDLKFLSYPAQVQHVCDTYPKGIETHFILGNHDEDAYKNNAGDPGQAIAAKRPDMLYHGWYNATVDIAGLRVRLQHGRGSSAYARTYKLQKYLEELPRGDYLHPHILSLGHYHTFVHLPSYQGVDAFLPGCFEGPNHLIRRMGVYPTPGAWILEVRIVDSEVRSLKATRHTFPLENHV